eukprot:g47396.t1
MPRHQSSAHKGSQQTPTITRLAPCFRLLQGARLLVLPTRDPSNPDNHSFGSVSSGVYYSCKKEARENKKSFHPSPPFPRRPSGEKKKKKKDGRAEGRGAKRARMNKQKKFDMLDALRAACYSCKGADARKGEEGQGGVECRFLLKRSRQCKLWPE